MRRSSSASSIPLRMSRLPVRDSFHQGSNRGTSVNRQHGPEKHSLTKASRSSSHSNLLDVPHISSKRSGSLVRQTLCTPLSQSRYSRLQRKSPGWSSLKKDTRPITDKHWQFDQISKVRNFVSKYFGHLELYDVSSIKSGISMDVFVSLINNYFQLLDNQAFVKRDNYIEEIPKFLKCFGYPGNVKPSLMKTVNTPHSWPHILAIFAWLSDLVTEIDIPEDYAPFSGIHNLIYLHTLEMLQQLQNTKEPESITRRKCLKQLDQEIVGYLNLDVNLLNDIDNQIKRLQTDIVNSNTRNEELNNNTKLIQSENKELSDKCEKYEFETKTFLTQLELQIRKHRDKINKLGEEIIGLKDKETSLQTVIDSQPYSLSQKEELAKELASLQVSKELGEQRRLQQQKLFYEYESKVTELMQSIKSSAYEYNNIVNNLEISNPEYRKLHIRESGFVRNDTGEELNAAAKMLQIEINNIKKAHETCEQGIEKLTHEAKKLHKTRDDVIKEVEELTKLHSELSLTIEFQKNKDELQLRKLSNEANAAQSELTELKKLRLDVKPLENEVCELRRHKSELEELLQKNRSESLFFFQELQKQMDQTAVSYMEIMSSISENFASIVETATNNMLQAQEDQSDIEPRLQL